MEIADYIVAEDRRLVELVLEGDDTASNTFSTATATLSTGCSCSGWAG